MDNDTDDDPHAPTGEPGDQARMDRLEGIILDFVDTECEGYDNLDVAHALANAAFVSAAHDREFAAWFYSWVKEKTATFIERSNSLLREVATTFEASKIN